MSAIRDKLARLLSDEKLYVKTPNVAIFDEHEERFWLDAEGKRCEPEDGVKEVVRRFDKKRLEEIAKRCNARDEVGSLSPITFGHTIPGEKDETKQPDPKGYALGYGVRYDKNLGRHVLATNFYIRRQDYEKAKSYPRISVELWPKHLVVDPIALIRRTPQRDLPQWVYYRGSDEVIRYSMESNMATRYELVEDDNEVETPESVEPSHGDKLEAYMKHCMSHPHARYMAEHYAMPETEPEPEEPELEDPTTMPSNKKPGMAAMNSAAASSTNTTLPRATSKDESDVSLNARRTREATLEKQIAELRMRLDETAAQKARAEGETWVTQLLSEGYELDADMEVERFARLDEAGRKKQAEYVRQYHRHNVIGQRATLLGEGSIRPQTDNSATGDDLEVAHFDEALQYVRAHPGISFDEALSKTKKK